MYLDPLAFVDLAHALRHEPRRKVLLPFDGSPASRRALEHVIAAEKGRDSHIHVINVQQPTLDDRAFLDALLHTGEEIIGWACGQLAAAEIKHTSEVTVGVPSVAIIHGARTENCTAIVMGIRGAIARFFSGSVSDQVVRLAGVPVTRVK